MIQANELRIGNWIMRANGFPQRIQAYDYEHTDFNAISSIPLTAEILEAAGFTTVTENADGSYNFWGKEIDASIDIEDGELFRYRVHEKERTKCIQYLHQLQNLYFALTGQELEVNL